MDAVIRALAVYFVVMFLFRVSGKRTLSQITAFDFVLLLIIGEATQQALLGEDFSITNAFTVIGTLLGIDIAMSVIKQRFKLAERLAEGLPVLLIHEGMPLHENIRRSRVDESDILHAARELQGLERLDQIKHAVLEVSGGITVVPKSQA